MGDLLNWSPHKLKTTRPPGLFIFAGVMWAVWRTRNKMAIEQKFPKQPIEIFRNFSPAHMHTSDVFEL